MVCIRPSCRSANRSCIFGGPCTSLRYMDSRNPSMSNPTLQPVASRLFLVMSGVSVQTALVVTVGIVPRWCRFARGNRSEGRCGTSEITVEDQQWEGVLW